MYLDRELFRKCTVDIRGTVQERNQPVDQGPRRDRSTSNRPAYQLSRFTKGNNYQTLCTCEGRFIIHAPGTAVFRLAGLWRAQMSTPSSVTLALKLIQKMIMCKWAKKKKIAIERDAGLLLDYGIIRRRVEKQEPSTGGLAEFIRFEPGRQFASSQLLFPNHVWKRINYKYVNSIWDEHVVTKTCRQTDPMCSGKAPPNLLVRPHFHF